MRTIALADLLAPKPIVPSLLSKSAVNSPTRDPIELRLLLRANRDLIQAKLESGELVQHGRQWQLTSKR